MIKCFIKWEKAKTDLEKDKPPRLIQHRSYEFTFMHKRVIQALVDMDKYLMTNIRFQPHCTIRTSGMDQYRAAQLFKDEWDSFYDPVAVLLDCSKFDGHVDYWQLECEIRVLESTYDYDLSVLLKRLFFNRGITHHGIPYSAHGARDSGSAATSKGNSDINEINLRTMIELSLSMRGEDLSDHRYYLHVNGDDSVIIASQDTVDLINFKLMEYMGHEIKVEVVDEFHKISYCQCQPVNVNGFWRMIREPIRVISRSAYVDQKYPLEGYLSALGLCELAVHHGVPILQKLAINHLIRAKFCKPIRIKYDTAFAGTSPVIEQISERTRYSFYRAFDISPEQQVYIEDSMALSIDTKSDPQISSEITTQVIEHATKSK